MTEAAPNFNHNDIVYSISEVSHALKRMVEDHFGVVKLRGEISGYKLHSSGHAYFTLKDADACIDAVCWRGSLGKMKFKPEDGLEVVAHGKLTTYPGRSKYQIVVDFMEPAGAGALMALLEKRRAQLEAEGLFAASRKRKIPYMPRVVGVVTSPTGAVIRDILHRISDRFPCHVIVWPVAVQGEGAAEQVANAIAGFNAVPEGPQRPDVIIVARGGGSLEDLWAFNEEIVVRAAAGSKIPLISAVGHETDTTLIDYASDMRAPTPTAAAEMAVPVLADLKLALVQLDARMVAAVKRQITQHGDTLTGLARGLPKPSQLLEVATQRLDDWSERHQQSLPAMLARKQQQLMLAVRGLSAGRLLGVLEQHGAHMVQWGERLQQALPALLARKEQLLASCAQGLKPYLLHFLKARENKLETLSAKLEGSNVQRILERGFTLVRGDDGGLVTSSDTAKKQKTLELQFADGRVKTTP